MYYLISTEYVGPDAEKIPYDMKPLGLTIEIHNRPMRDIKSGEIVVDGWCGTSSDISTYAHGVYPNLEEARDAISYMFTNVLREDIKGNYPLPINDERVVEWGKPVSFIPLSAESTRDLMEERNSECPIGWWDLDAESTDESIEEMTHDTVWDIRTQIRDIGTKLEVDPDRQAIMDFYHDERRAEKRSHDNIEEHFARLAKRRQLLPG